jgi:outer membrane protein assembly factor BamB
LEKGAAYNDISHPASRISHPASRISHPASHISHPTSRISHPASRISHPASHISHPASHISHPASWPTYRHDAERSGTTRSPLPADLKKAWETDIGGRATGCVAVDDIVALADVESHQVLAYDPNNGKRRWCFTADGRVDTPPTLFGGQAYFGCTDGRVYCVRLSDGGLVWRFRGAPEDRLVGAFEGVESAWPIHGSVLVQDGAVYFTAGRSSFLDDGIFAYSLDARTGNMLSEQRIATPYSMEVDIGRDQLADTGLLSDLLVSHGGSIYMRQRELFLDDNEETTGGPLRSTGGLLDDSWFSRTRWHLDDTAYAEYFVFDAKSIYGVRARDSASDNGGFFAPAARGYELLAADLPPFAAGEDRQAKRALGKKKPPLRKRWSIRAPWRVTSMVLAGETLFAAGTPDTIDPDDPWAAYEGRRGGVLLAIASDDGRVLAQYKLESPAVLDGLAAAHGRLYVSSADGKVLCFAGR